MAMYNADIEYGEGGATQIEARTLQEATEKAEAWARKGDYSDVIDRDGGCSVLVRTWLSGYDAFDYAPDDGRYESMIDIVPSEPDCPESAEHDWTREFEGGCSDNPGCWDIGGGRMKFVSHCRHCGMERVEISLYAPGNSLACAGVPDETVAYGEPDHEWVAEHITD